MRQDEGVRDYFHIAVIGYGASVGSALGGRLSDRWLVPISAVADAPARLEQRPEHLGSGAAEYGFETTPSTRGFVYNSDVTTLVQFLDIGTRARDLR